MIIVDETVPEGDLPSPFPCKDVVVKFNDDVNEYYDLKKEIGRGRFGTVYLCTCKKTGLNFAAKFVNTKRAKDRENVEREIEVMKVLNKDTPHPKLIQLYDAFDMGKQMCLVLEVVDGGELFERVIDDDFVLTERACAIFVRQICEGILFIHSKNVLHLDMKPENILCLSREGNRVKICDFGLARCYDPRKKLQVLFGTPEFVAPEVVLFEPIGFSTDMWSVGVICYVLLSGLSPFLGANYVETMTNVTKKKYDFDDEAFEDISEEAKEFIEGLLILEKSERLTPDQCVKHRWMKKSLSGPSIQAHISTRNDIDINQIACDNKDELITENVLQVHMNVNKDAIECNLNVIQLDVEKENEMLNQNPSDKERISISVDCTKAEPQKETGASSHAEHISGQIQEQPINSDRKRKQRDSNECELESAKKQLIDFVEERKTTTNSPYAILSPDIAPSLRTVANNDIDPVINFELAPMVINVQIGRIHSELQNHENTDASIYKMMSPEEIATQLEVKLTELQNNQIDNMNSIGKENIAPEEKQVILVPEERVRLKRQNAIQLNMKEQSPKPEKGHNPKFRPSRDVPMITSKKECLLDSTKSPSSHTPLRRSRRTSNEECSSFDNRVQAHRRPSRDVPLATSQAIRNRCNFKQSKTKGKANSQEIWPDVYLLSVDKTTGYPVLPVTGKLELPVVVLPAINKSEIEQDINSEYLNTSCIEKAKSLDDPGTCYTDNKQVQWIIDITSTKEMLSGLPEDAYKATDTHFMELPYYREADSYTGYFEKQGLNETSQSCNTTNEVIGVSSANNYHDKFPATNGSVNKLQNIKTDKYKESSDYHLNDILNSSYDKGTDQVSLNSQEHNIGGGMSIHPTIKQLDDECKHKEFSCSVKTQNLNASSEQNNNQIQQANVEASCQQDTRNQIMKPPLNVLHNNTNISENCHSSSTNPPNVHVSLEEEQNCSSNLIRDNEYNQNKSGIESHKNKANVKASPAEDICKASSENDSINNTPPHLPSASNPLNSIREIGLKKRKQDTSIESHSTSTNATITSDNSGTLSDRIEDTIIPLDIKEPLSANLKLEVCTINKKPNLPIPDSPQKSVPRLSRRNCSEELKAAKLNKSPSSSSIKPSDSNENVTVDTPWGPMRKSPSRNSLKSPDRNIVIVNLSDTSESDKVTISTKNITEDNDNGSTVTVNSKKDETNIKMNGFKSFNIPIYKKETKITEITSDCRHGKEVAKSIPHDTKCKTVSQKLNTKETSNLGNTPLSKSVKLTPVSKNSGVNIDNISTNASHIIDKSFNGFGKQKNSLSKVTMNSSQKDILPKEETPPVAIKIDISYEELFGSKTVNDPKIEELQYKHQNNCTTNGNSNKSIRNIDAIKTEYGNSKNKVIQRMESGLSKKNDPNNNGMYTKVGKKIVDTSAGCNKLNKFVDEKIIPIELTYNAINAKQLCKENTKQSANLNTDCKRTHTLHTNRGYDKSQTKNDYNILKGKSYDNKLRLEVKSDQHQSKDISLEQETIDNKPQSKISPHQNFSVGLKNSMSMKASMDKFYDTSDKRNNIKHESEQSKLNLKLSEKDNISEPMQTDKNNKLHIHINGYQRESKESSKRNSNSDSDREDGSLICVARRKSRSGSNNSSTASFRMSLFSAQDRISLFEKKQDNVQKRAPVPISRSSTSTLIGDKSPTAILNQFNRNSIYGQPKTSVPLSIHTHA